MKKLHLVFIVGLIVCVSFSGCASSFYPDPVSSDPDPTKVVYDVVKEIPNGGPWEVTF